MRPCQLFTQAVRIPILIFPPSQSHAQETPSSPVGGVTLAPKWEREAKEVVLSCPWGQRQGIECTGTWEAEGDRSQG